MARSAGGERPGHTQSIDHCRATVFFRVVVFLFCSCFARMGLVRFDGGGGGGRMRRADRSRSPTEHVWGPLEGGGGDR